MKLESITLENFRQFAGRQSLNLNSDNTRPVTLIFGANGSGKTTLLNAFTWALYGGLSDDVEQQDRLATDSVWRSTPLGESVPVSVEVKFSHEDRSYRLLRSVTLRKESDHQQHVVPAVQLWVTTPDGASEEVKAPQEMIHTILPRGVSRFFFFNGERIENLVKKDAYSEVQKDIKVLLDLEQVERALSHLPKVDRKLSADLRKNGGERAGQIQEEIDKLCDQQEHARNRLLALESEVASLNGESERVLELLRENADAAPIQKRRDQVEKELAEARRALDSARTERAALLATRGFLAFTNTLASETKEMAEDLYRRGALPAPLKREFVDNLLEKKVCICGAELIEGSDPWNHVQNWRHQAGLQAVETAWQKLSGNIDELEATRASLRSDLAGITKRIGDENDRVERLIAEKSELDGKLRDSRREDVQALESKHMELLDMIRSKEQQIGSAKSEIERLVSDIEAKTRERSKAEVKDELALKARARLELVQSVKNALTEILEIRATEMRNRLDAELKSVFASITHQSHVPTLTEKFELTLHKTVNGVELPVPKSTGENQILSLSFVAAVSKLAREIRSERRAEEQTSVDAGTYPIVMDAAFGSLDEDYQEAVARALAKMAPQLVVLVSKSQGMGTVITELMPYVSNLGVLETYTTAQGDVADDIEINGRSYPYIRASETDRTELKVIL
ncbi:AAA family ATPase [Rhodococcus sp. Z13]|uniref:AAA family ATPase n=1 Tax=Rhodococcus sacchari TaxID=2962047 RepID=A0ACD4DJG8_9NOCA|nr:AAA family ATPase [Rhodococcus sp. Z13]UYP20204.1 AAA family ATPase [Rhodococcus sp. Z13]